MMWNIHIILSQKRVKDYLEKYEVDAVEHCTVMECFEKKKTFKDFKT